MITLTWQDFYNTVAVVGFLLSAFTFIQRLLNEKLNLKLSIEHFDFYGNNVWFYTVLENHSRLPVSIIKIQLIGAYDELIYSAELQPSVLKTEYINKELIKVHSLGFPIELSSLGARSGNLYFLMPVHHNPSLHKKSLNLIISTNRGKVMIALPPPNRVKGSQNNTP